MFRTVHGSRPNNSDRERYAQFVKMFPASPMDSERAAARAASINKKINSAGLQDCITDLGKHLFGLQSWNSP
jgi:hypothetical protein